MVVAFLMNLPGLSGMQRPNMHMCVNTIHVCSTQQVLHLRHVKHVRTLRVLETPQHSCSIDYVNHPKHAEKLLVSMNFPRQLSAAEGT
jgi:hypothetical protein